MSLYVYCVLDAVVKTPDMAGIQGQAARIVTIDDLNAIVSDFSGTELIPTKENVFTHERIIEACLDSTTPLPFRFGAVISEAKLAECIRSNATVLKGDLEKVRGCVEMGIKVMMTPPEIPQSPTGTDFLRAKQRQQDLQKQTAAWVGAAVVGLVQQTEVSFIPGTSKFIVRIAHLVLRDHLQEYKSHIDALVRQRTEYGFLQSGPWPPYSFISMPSLT